MAVCENLEKCPFVAYCNQHDAETSAKGFIHMYCKGAKMDNCIRLRLCHKFSRDVVPKNMMPNGFPLSGTSKDGWSEQALNFRIVL